MRLLLYWGTAAGLAILAYYLFSGSREFTLCSPMEGKLIDAQGNPKAQIEVVREWRWGSLSGISSTITDNNGRFEFGLIKATTFSSLHAFLSTYLPQEPAVRQVYHVVGKDGGKVEFLSLNKNNYDMNGEVGNMKFDVTCNLDAQIGTTGFYYSNCSLNSILPKEQVD